VGVKFMLSRNLGLIWAVAPQKNIND